MANNSPESTSAIHFSAQIPIEKNPCKVTKFLYLAMTGEITLQGRVTAIGGVREKLVGAIRAGIKTVLVPQDNRKDVEELPENIRKSLDIHFVDSFTEAVKIAFK